MRLVSSWPPLLNSNAANIIVRVLSKVCLRVVQGQLGEFPDCLEEIMLGSERDVADREKRRAAIVRVIMRRLLTGLKRIHSLGLVHRDVSRKLWLTSTVFPVLSWLPLLPVEQSLLLPCLMRYLQREDGTWEMGRPNLCCSIASTADFYELGRLPLSRGAPFWDMGLDKGGGGLQRPTFGAAGQA